MKNNFLYNLIIKRRSIRLFKQKEVPYPLIIKLVNSARLAPSAANSQFLEYLVINKKNLRDLVFPHLHWASYVAPKRNPSLNQRPTLYILILINKEKSLNPNLRDIGAAAENILLSLENFGLGGCWLQNIEKEALVNILKIPKNYELDSIIACGYPLESPKLEISSTNIKYWIDKNNRLHVPKRPLREILHYNRIKK
ncbi:MAG: nitroreductase family protein [Candidatus Aenigmatarchaeota archaeon]